MERPDHVSVARAPERFSLDYRDGEAWIEETPLRAIIDAVGTPTYVYSLAHIRRQYRALHAALPPHTKICYAVKANGALAVLRCLAGLGAGADIVSGGELARAVRAGIPVERIVFSGVGKTDPEIDAAIAAGLHSINVESAEELHRVAERARALNKIAPISLRVNPDVDPKTHPYLATGLDEAKFGIAMSDAIELARFAHEDPHLQLLGLACHIGSQIHDTSPFVDSIARLAALRSTLAASGIPCTQLDIGGGFAIAYRPHEEELNIETWGRAVSEATSALDVDLVVEPGRFLVGNAGVLLTEVIGTKRGNSRSFVIVDAAMNDLLRPSLYGAYHAIVPLELPPTSTSEEIVDIVGPVCESGDFLAQRRPLALVRPGQHLAVLSAGAYGLVMASTYNTRPTPAEVVVDGSRWSVIRARKTVTELLDEERVPDWLDD